MIIKICLINIHHHTQLQRLFTVVRILRSTLLAPFEYTCVRACSVAQTCPTLCDPMDCSLLGFSVQGIFQARMLGWVAISNSIQTHNTVLLPVVAALSTTSSSNVLFASCTASCSVNLFPLLSNTHRIPALSTSPDFYEKQI